ncbi:MAG: flagellar basal body rod C-terminal domain-containing protein [Phycisphaerales bacterium]
MYGSLDISVSGMIAQRVRHETAAANIAGKDAYLDSSGVNPYRARRALFAVGDPSAKTVAGRQLGVHVAEIQIDQNAVRWKYDPSNPHAEKSGPRMGHILVPDINDVVEKTNSMEAQRAYEANIVAAEATKSMMAQALRLLA